jgi:hypothetical protein
MELYLTVDTSSAAGYSPDINDMRMEDVESPMLKAVAKERLLKTQRTEKT